MTRDELLIKVASLNVFRKGERRAPHKPLLLLIALSKLRHGETSVTFTEIERILKPLLNAYAPPVVNRHQPALPYWHLQSDELWEVDNADELERQKGGFPKIHALRKTRGNLPENVVQLIAADAVLTSQLIAILLTTYFPESLQEDLITTLGLDFGDQNLIQEAPATYTAIWSKRRDPAFRGDVLRAYEYRCALTGFRAALGGSYFGCEAAHVQWHAYDGPDSVANGLTLEPTMHKLFDAGAWSLTDDHRVLVSAEFTGSDNAIDRLRSLHGKAINSPLAGNPLVSNEFIRWHRDPNLGGVFREPALLL